MVVRLAPPCPHTYSFSQVATKLINLSTHSSPRMLLFVVAFLTLCLNDSNLSTRLLVGIIFLAIIVLITWCLLSGISIAADTWFAGSRSILSRRIELTKKNTVVLHRRWKDRTGYRAFLWDEMRRCFNIHEVEETGPGVRPSDTASYSTNMHATATV